MSVEFRRTLDLLLVVERSRLRDLVEAAQGLLLEMDWSHLNRSEDYVRTAPPKGLLQGTVATPEDVVDAIRSVPERWRLDVAVALEDYID